jgi:tetratricopeptide (TPR) repeat protein
MPITPPPGRKGVLGPLVLGAALLATIAALGFWARPRPVLNQREVERLLSQGRLRQAEAVVDAYLARVPDDPRAHFQKGRLLLDGINRAESDDAARERVEAAREHLERFEPGTPAETARRHLYDARALYVLKQWRQVEKELIAALQADPAVPDATWALLDLYYLQGRSRDAQRLVERQFSHEPDPRDRALLLLELIRQDVQPSDAGSILQQLEPVVATDADDLASRVALGLTQIRGSQLEAGLATLRQAVARHPDDAVAREGLLEGLAQAGEAEALAGAVGELPGPIAGDPRFARFAGRAAQAQGDWKAAIAAYRTALAFDPTDAAVLYQLAQVLRRDGQEDEAVRLLGRHEQYTEARGELQTLYQEAAALRDLGVGSYPDLYGRLADQRERMLREAEAARWRTILDSTTRGRAGTTRP